MLEEVWQNIEALAKGQPAVHQEVSSTTLRGMVSAKVCGAFGR